ncbi:MAG: OmpA family protein [Treponema sp.]|jgi:outer membrane protein OmpA-like peptidoglycan-associated protein|nr:OmpA family protein [Treponema sp.]
MKMKKLIFVVFTVAIIAACKGTPALPAVNPGTSPELEVKLPEMFSPNPDIADDKMTISIAVKHAIPIKDWTIQIQPARRQTAQSGQAGVVQAAQQLAGQTPQAAQAAQRLEGQAAAAGQAGQTRQPRAPFFEQTGTGFPPKTWQWNGKSSRPSGEMVQSATDYQFTLSVNDLFGNNGVYEGIISVDVLVRREGDTLRIIVPSIIFPPNASDFALLSEEDRRSNTRVLRRIANALNKYPDYKITVEGHSNPTTAPNTPARTNEEARELKPLSESRAKSVVDFLVANDNIPRVRLNSVGIGGVRTVADYNDDDESWKNRRVEFILHK